MVKILNLWRYMVKLWGEMINWWRLWGVMSWSIKIRNCPIDRLISLIPNKQNWIRKDFKDLKKKSILSYYPIWSTIWWPASSNSYPPASSNLSYISYQLGMVKANICFLQDTFAHAASQHNKERAKLFCIHKLTDAYNWLVLLWLTGDWKYAIPPTQKTWPILLF